MARRSPPAERQPLSRELAEPDLVTRIEQVLQDADLDPWFLVVELTESALLVDPIRAEERLRRLKELGISLASTISGRPSRRSAISVVFPLIA